MYRSSTDSIRDVAMSILAADAGMNKQKAIKTLMDLDPKELMDVSKQVEEQGGAGKAVMAMDKDSAALSSAIKVALLALAVLMPAASAGDQSDVAEAIAKAKEQVAEAKRDTELAAGMTTISGKKYIGNTKGQVEALGQIAKLDNKLKAEGMETMAREEIIENLVEATGAREAK